MSGDQSGTDEIFMAAQQAVGAATAQTRDSQGRHEWSTKKHGNICHEIIFNKQDGNYKITQNSNLKSVQICK